MIIGITGLIGSGKSTGAAICRNMGLAVIEADSIGRQVVERNPSVLKKLQRKFGNDIISISGSLLRKKLAKRAFADNVSRKALDQIVHPALVSEISRQLKIFKNKQKHIVIDAALLIEWEIINKCDRVILIHASQKDRVKRLRDKGYALDDIIQRLKRQKSYTHYRRFADKVIFNNTNEVDLRRKLTRYLTQQGIV